MKTTRSWFTNREYNREYKIVQRFSTNRRPIVSLALIYTRNDVTPKYLRCAANRPYLPSVARVTREIPLVEQIILSGFFATGCIRRRGAGGNANSATKIKAIKHIGTSANSAEIKFPRSARRCGLATRKRAHGYLIGPQQADPLPGAHLRSQDAASPFDIHSTLDSPGNAIAIIQSHSDGALHL